MKSVYRNILLLALICGASISLNAQDFDKYKIAFKINPNIAWLTPQSNDVESVGARLRFGYGVNADISFTENYAIGTGLSIESNGGVLKYQDLRTIDSTDYIIEKERNYNIRYVEIPLSLKLRTNEIGYITYYGQFGLGLGVKVGAKADDVDEYLSEYSIAGDDLVKTWHTSDRAGISEENINIADEINVFRAALIIGAGLEYNLQGNTSIVAGITFNNGFTNILNGERAVQLDAEGVPVFVEGSPNTERIKVNSSHIAINIGILF